MLSKVVIGYWCNIDYTNRQEVVWELLKKKKKMLDFSE